MPGGDNLDWLVIGVAACAAAFSALTFFVARNRDALRGEPIYGDVPALHEELGADRRTSAGWEARKRPAPMMHTKHDARTRHGRGK